VSLGVVVHDESHGLAAPVVVLLHGFMGCTEDLAPFARSLGLNARFVFPEGPVDLAPQGRRGRAWWPNDTEGTRPHAKGPRDLSEFVPHGLSRARRALENLLASLASEAESGPIFLGGFSQGAMLSCDLALRTTHPIAGLVLFSGTRIAHAEWCRLYSGRRALRVFISHGRYDDDLSFGVAEAFQGELAAAGWDVTWLPFDGGHEVPLAVWRAFKRWLTQAAEGHASPSR
jgi:phospholipase/carboxylesterase